MFLLFFLSFITAVSAQECPNVTQAPLCPNSGSTLLDDTYPTQAFVISTKGYSTGRAGGESNIQLPAKFITGILQSYPKDHPAILVPSNPADFEKLKLEVSQNLQAAKVPQDKIDLQLSKIKMVDAPPYTWQQDYFESFVNLETGKPDLRAISSYNKTPLSSASYTTAIANSLTCGTNGKPLEDKEKSPDSDKSWGNGEMGGNIEGLPGGLCLKGNNQAKSFVSQYCPLENAVEIDVGWLSVGHTDELIKVVPVLPKTSPAECSFSIMVASPEAAFETLKEPDYAKRSFIELNEHDPVALETKIKDVVKSQAGGILCNILRKNHSEPEQKKTKSEGATRAFLQILNQFTFYAHAGSGAKSISTFSCEKVLKEVTNRKMLELLSQDQNFMDTNRLVQEKMNKAKSDMKAKLNEKMPQCKNIHFIDAPDLFYNNIFAEINGARELPQPGRAGSLFPNPTNSVLANETLIISETPNYAFNDKLSKILKQNGLKSTFVDTWNYAHRGDGNLHCSSHSIPYCQPRGKQ